MSAGPDAVNQDETPSSNQRRRVHFEEHHIPQIGTSLVTGLTGAPTWGALNKSSPTSRPTIGEGDSDDLQNYLPMGTHLLQMPTKGANIATLPSPIIWQTTAILNANVYFFSLCQNGHVYQTTTSGVNTDIWQSAQFSQNGTLNSTNIVTALSNTAIISVGMSVTGTDIPNNTTVTSIDSSSQIHISNAATGNGTFSLSFSTPLFTTVGTVDIAGWQSTLIILSDSASQKVYSWNGTNLLIVFNAQPVQYITVFQNRLWMAQTLSIQWTNVNTYNSLAGDSGSYLITDSTCLNPINCLLDSPYGLFVSGSNWFKFISNLSDVGVPAVLTFQQNTIETQIGPYSKWSVLVIGNVIFFANNAGIWAINGGQPSQISQPFLDGFFSNLQYPKTVLTLAYGMINSVPCLFCQAYYNGDTQVAAGYTVFGFTLQTQQWFRVTDGTMAWTTGVVAQFVTSANPEVFACDGTNIFQLFSNTTTTSSCQYNSKLWDLGSTLDIDNILNVAVEFVLQSASTITVAQLDETNTVRRTTSQTLSPGGITIINNVGLAITIVNNSLAAITIIGGTTVLYNLFQDDGCGRVRRIALNVNISGIGASLISLVISYHRTETGRGS